MGSELELRHLLGSGMESTPHFAAERSPTPCRTIKDPPTNISNEARALEAASNGWTILELRGINVHSAVRGRRFMGTIFRLHCLILAVSPAPAPTAGRFSVHPESSAWTRWEGPNAADVVVIAVNRGNSERSDPKTK